MRPHQHLRGARADRAETPASRADGVLSDPSFFWDPELFRIFANQLFPRLLKGRPPDDPVRVWVPGCANGEDVYSIGIALLECLREQSLSIPIRIFGSDLSDLSLRHARSAVYPENIGQNVAPELLSRYFTRSGSSYQAIRALRERCIFAHQDLCRDAPFSKLDLIVCRKLLSHLNPQLQSQAVEHLRYALKPGGHLVIGTGEDIQFPTDWFTVVSAERRLFSKTTHAHPRRLNRAVTSARLDQQVKGPRDLVREADRIMLGRFAPAGVVVTADLVIVGVRGRIGRFLATDLAEPGLNLLEIARPGLARALRTAMARAKRKEAPVRKEAVPVSQDATIALEVIPLRQPASSGPHFLVLFDDTSPASPKHTPQGPPGRTAESRRLKRELGIVKQRLESTIDELEVHVEELTSANAEVQSGNEDLQSFNEELEAARAELQSTNQELETFNRELSANNRELVGLNDDLSNLLSTVELAVVMVDSELRLRRFTPAAGKLLNLIPTDVGRPILDFKPRLEIPDLESLLHDVFDNLRVIEREVRDERGHSYLMCVRPYRTRENRIEGAQMALTDITERKHLDDQLRQSQKMETIGRLAGGVAHDFNNILTAISGYAAELLKTLPASHPGRKAAEQIGKVGDQAGMFAKQLLAVTRKQVVRPCRVDLNDILGDMRNLLEHLLGDTIEIRYACTPDLGTVVVDSSQIQQVILNLAINARDAMADGGRLTLSTANVFLDPRDAQAEGLPAGAYVTLTASDTGAGMGPATRGRVFEPFFTTKPPGAGTGLGLSMVYGIVQQSGGTISLESEVGEGATLRIYFPRTADLVEAAPVEVHENTLGGNETILLVEDARVVRTLIHEVLVQRGYTVLEASDGAEALSISARHPGPIHLLLTDLLMPRIGGDELSQRIRRRRRDIKVIYMSGYGGEVFHAVKKNANFLEKPFKPDGLAMAIRKVLDE